jgi:hypothetical protein
VPAVPVPRCRKSGGMTIGLHCWWWVSLRRIDIVVAAFPVSEGGGVSGQVAGLGRFVCLPRGYPATRASWYFPVVS